MKKPNYQTICQSLLKDLSGRTKEVMLQRFGLVAPVRLSSGQVGGETLQSIGKDYNITRERVRQIEEDGLKRIEKKIKEDSYQNVFRYFINYLKANGNLKKEDILLEQLGGSKFKNHVFFLLTLGDQFGRFTETKDFHSVWAINKNSLQSALKVINSFIADLESRNQPLSLPAGVSSSYIEISKHILKNPEGLYGLKHWPEINPRGIKDKAYIVFKKKNRPLHFAEAARFVGKDSLPQTIHNELIKDPRFVLIGRGLYALADWGYEPGVVKDVLSKVLKEARRPLTKEEIVEKALKQRLVKENTIVQNLQNKKHFLKNLQGKYTLRKA